MEVIVELLLYAIFVLIYSVIGGWLIKDSIGHFKNHEYFMFGMELMLAIQFIVWIAELALEV